MPFGAKASVYAWERLGHLIATVARRVLKLPVFRYVDDFFAPEPQVRLARSRFVVCPAFPPALRSPPPRPCYRNLLPTLPVVSPGS